MTLAAAHASGACPIVITESESFPLRTRQTNEHLTSLSASSVLQSRLDFAKTLVPSVRTVLVKPGTAPEDVAREIKEAAGMELSVALECTGVQSSIWSAIHSLTFGGTCFIIGVGREVQELPFMVCSAREIDVRMQYR